MFNNFAVHMAGAVAFNFSSINEYKMRYMEKRRNVGEEEEDEEEII